MLGLGSSLYKAGKVGKSIIRDGLVLKHDYNAGAVEPCSTGAANLNADAAANEYIDVGTTTNIGTSDISFSAWVYLTSFVDFGGIFGARKRSGSYEGFEVRTMDENTIQVVLDDGDSSASAVSSVLNANQWYHVGVSVDRSGGAGSLQLYIDGVKDGDDNTESDGSSIGSIGITTRIGQAHGADEMQGYICNVGYWLGTALTQPQVKSIMLKDYASLSASEKTNLVSWWNLDSVIDSASYANSSGSTSVYDNHHGGSETLSANIVTGYNLGSGFSEWAVYDPEGGGATISTDGSVITVNVKDGANSDNQGARCELTSSLAVGKTYEVTADLWLGTYVPNPAGEFVIYLAGKGVGVTLTTTRTTYTRYITATNVNDVIFYQSDADENEGTFFISNVSVKLVNGNTGTLS